MCEGVNMNADRIQKSIELSDWIAQRYELLPIVCNGRAELAVTCYYITWQHQAAVAQLCRLGLFAPATALIRCAWDSYTRGMWLQFAATATQIEIFKQDGTIPKDKEILLAIQKAIPETENGFMKAREAKYSHLCDLTHTGISQISNHFVAGEITADLSDSVIQEVLRFVEAMALGSLSQSALIANNQTVASEAFDRIRRLDSEL